MNAQHTAGEWVFLRQGKEIQSDGGHEIISEMNGLPVLLASLHVCSENSDHERAYNVSKTESIANGYLLAAAPAMYEALKIALRIIEAEKDACGIYKEHTEKIRAALSAAEGRE